MKKYLYSKIGIIVLTLLSVSYLIADYCYRENFKHLNRATNPNQYLEDIKTPTTFAISFNKYLRIDTVYIHNGDGNVLLKMRVKWSQHTKNSDFRTYTADSSLCETPYTYNLNSDDEVITTINVLERMLDTDYEHFLALHPNLSSDDMSYWLYIDYYLLREYWQKIYLPLLRQLFNSSLCVRSTNPNSILKYIIVNNVGRVSSMVLYNNSVLGLDCPLGWHITNTPENYMGVPEDSIDYMQLVTSYKYDLETFLPLNRDKEAQELAESHFRELMHTIKNEKLEILFVRHHTGTFGYKSQIEEEIFEWVDEREEWTWLNVFPIGIIITLIYCFICFSAEWEKYHYKTNRNEQNSLDK